MDPFIEAGAAAIVAGYLVALWKMAQPTAPSWALVVVSLVAGIGSSFLIAVAEGAVLTAQVGAQIGIQGVAAAAIAAGLTRTDSAAEAKRPDSALRSAQAQAKRL